MSPTIYVFSKNMKKKTQNFYLKTLFSVVKFSVYLNRRVFVMTRHMYNTRNINRSKGHDIMFM